MSKNSSILIEDGSITVYLPVEYQMSFDTNMSSDIYLSLAGPDREKYISKKKELSENLDKITKMYNNLVEAEVRKFESEYKK